MNLKKIIKDLILNINWKSLEKKSEASFLSGIHELIESGELDKNINDYKTILQKKSLNIVDIENGVPTIMLTYSVLEKENEIGYYKFITELDLTEIDDYLVFY